MAPRDRRSSMRTLFEVRGVRWAVMLAGSVVLLALSYAVTRLVLK